MSKENISVHSSLIGGKARVPGDPTGEWWVRSPAQAEEEYAQCLYAYSQIDEATEAAIQGARSWSERSRAERIQILNRAHERIKKAQPTWFQIASRELGRSSNDLKLEFRQWERWFDAWSAQAESSLQTRQESRGITALVGSYVWPLFHTLPFVFLNLLAGNPIVIKPSEKSTLSVLALGELLTSDPALASLVHILIGEKETGRRLACHDQVQTVIFVGSFEVGMRVKQDTLSQPSKEVLLYLGAKNPMVVCEDAPDAKVLDALIQDAFLSSGQHCRSASIAFIHQSRYSGFCDALHERAKQFKIGAPSSEPFAGPLIDNAMVDRYLKFSGISEREGAQLLMRGKPLVLPEKGNYVTPTLAAFEAMTPEQVKKSISLQTEILSPHLSLIRYSSYDELIELIRPLQHGLAASIWGENADRTKAIARDLAFGQVSVNQSLLEWDPCESFQARKRSGNHAYYGLKLIEQLVSLKSVGSV